MHRSRNAMAATFIAAVLVACGGPGGEPPPPTAPAEVRTTAGPGYVDVTWMHDGVGVDGFVVERRVVDGGVGPTSATSFVSVGEVGPTARSFRDAEVVLGPGYVYRVIATSSAGTSAAVVQDAGPSSAACAAPGDVVLVEDPNLTAAIASALGLGGTTLTCADLEGLTTLDESGSGIVSLVGLQYATNLTQLLLNQHAISDLWPLAGHAAIEELQLIDNQIVDLAPLAAMPALLFLQVSGNQVVDASPLAGLPELRVLMLSENADLESIDVVRDLQQLRYFGAARTAVSDLSPLANHPFLFYVWLNGLREVTDFSPLATLTGLQTMLVGDTNFGDADMPMLAAMPDLTRLQLWETEVTDLSALSGVDLRVELDLCCLAIADFSPIHHMTGLEQLRLNALGLENDDIAFLADFDALQLLHLRHNSLTSLAALVANPSLLPGLVVDARDNLLDLSDPTTHAEIADLESRVVVLDLADQRSE